MYNNTQEVQRWFADGGDNAMRYTYSLDESSIVVDLGGFKGHFADRIYKKYGCTVHVFEPITDFYKECVATNINNPKVIVYQEGISAYADDCASISIAGDSSSIFKSHSATVTEKIKLRPVSKLFSPEHLNLSKIDLLKINVEGAEFDILDALLKDGSITKIKNIQVQFHSFIVNSDERLLSIQEGLRKTHHSTYNYHFVWENWTINSQ